MHKSLATAGGVFVGVGVCVGVNVWAPAFLAMTSSANVTNPPTEWATEQNFILSMSGRRLSKSAFACQAFSPQTPYTFPHFAASISPHRSHPFHIQFIIW